MQIYHFGANRIEDIIIFVEFLGFHIIAVFEFQLWHIFHKFIFASYSHGVDPSGSYSTFVSPTYPLGNTQMHRKKLIWMSKVMNEDNEVSMEINDFYVLQITTLFYSRDTAQVAIGS